MDKALAITAANTSIAVGTSAHVAARLVSAASTREPALGPQAAPSSLVILDPRALDRQCLAYGFISHGITHPITHFAGMKEWKQASSAGAIAAAVLLYIRGQRIGEPAVKEEIKAVVAAAVPAKVILLADSDDITQVKLALDLGVGGYVPSNVSIEVCIKIIELVRAGGIFIPASGVKSAQLAVETQPASAPSLLGNLTKRQASVAEALRRGKANKAIAYELNMCESTVKVHIHNIMKKLAASNRTEVAYVLNNLMQTR